MLACGLLDGLVLHFEHTMAEAVCRREHVYRSSDILRRIATDASRTAIKFLKMINLANAPSLIGVYDDI
jgi:hypothetical protein